MKVRVLGCSGAIAKDCRTTSFLIDGDVLVDAGTGVGDLTLEEMKGVKHVLLTHSHLDHVAALPLMIDAIASSLTQPIQVHALPGTIAALKAHVFNNVIWPDFSRIPSPQAPFISFHELHVGHTLHLNGKHIEVLPAVHTVPACGYAVTSQVRSDTSGSPGFSSLSASTCRISGKPNAQRMTTTIVPIPPKTTLRTGPSHSAVRPDSTPPSSLELPMKIRFTALTLPRMRSGVRSWIVV